MIQFSHIKIFLYINTNNFKGMIIVKTLKRIASALVSACIALSCAPLSPKPIKTEAAVNVVISPLNKYEINNGVFEGWGTSLCWWANRVGYSDSLAQQCADTFFGDNGLRLNIARFNIGGGDDPSHNHITRTDSNMPGYTKYQNGVVTYDWSADYNQRNVLKRAIKAAGDDMIVEMFSNSPPYYMTKSGCSTGGTDPNKNNLKDDQYDDFAAYLAEVCYHYKNDWGIDIQSVEPVNEPYTDFWGAYSKKQEGCHFDQGSSESTMIVELQKAMKAKGMGDVIISGTDETSIDTQITSYNKLSNEAKNALGRIDTHTYGGSQRSQLKELAISAGKNLWMSEVDGNGTAGSDAGEMASGLWLADRIITDCNGLNCSAWILWQVIDSHISSVGYNGNKDGGMVNTAGGFWGLAVADHDKNNIVLTKKYYSFGQFTRYIRPGMIMLRSSGSTLAAYDPASHKVVIIALNKSGSASDMSFDLSGFNSVGAYASATRTSLYENWKDIGNTAISGSTLKVSLAPNSITTFVINDVTGSAELGNKIDVNSSMLTGSDSWKSDSSTSFKMAFDGKNSTFFDGLSQGWVQADLGKLYDITAIGYCPRSGYEFRMPDGYFQFSENGTDWTTAYTISATPSYGMNYVNKLSGNKKVRYVRYTVPGGTPSNGVNNDSSYCCNVAEIELYGIPSAMADLKKISPASVSGSSSWKDNESTNYTKAFDGNASTYFDGVGDGWIQADLGGLYNIKAISYTARKSYEYRMLDGQFMVSTDGINWKKLGTVDQVPDASAQYIYAPENTQARYIRYQVPEGKPNNGVNGDDVYCCNIAEMEIYGELSKMIGDINADNSVNIADLVLLQKYLLRKTDLTSEQSFAADLNSDGIIDGFDSILLRRKVIAR